MTVNRFKSLLVASVLSMSVLPVQAMALEGHVVYCHYSDGSVSATRTNNSLDTLSVMRMCHDDGGIANTIEN